MATLAPRPWERCRSMKGVTTLNPASKVSRAGDCERSTVRVAGSMACLLSRRPPGGSSVGPPVAPPCYRSPPRGGIPLPRRSHVLPAVDAEHLTGDRPGRGGEKEQHCLGHVLHLGAAPQHRLLHGPGPDLLRQG